MKTKRLVLAAFMVLFTTAAATAETEGANLAPNPGAEKTHSYLKQNKHCSIWVKDKTKDLPRGWGYYTGAGKWDYGISTKEKKSGDNSVYVELLETRHDEKRNLEIGSVGVFFGGECNGYQAGNSIKVKEGENYRFSFWIKGTVPQAQVRVLGFIKGKRVFLPVAFCDDTGKKLNVIFLTNDWKRYEAEVTVPEGCEQMNFGVYNRSAGRRGTNDQIGTKMFIDDVEIIKEEN